VTALTSVRPVRRFYLGLTANPYDALSAVTWTEIPNTKVKTSTLKWGAQHELGEVEPSYVSLLLDNTSGDFEALNAASPHYPNLRPLNRLRIVDTWAAVDYIRFTGYVVAWPRSWTGIGQSVVALEAYDALGSVLNAIDLPASPWEFEVRNIIEQVPAGGKACWLRLNETSGTVAADSSGYGLDGTYQGTPTLGVEGLGADGDLGFQPIVSSGGDRVSLPYKNLITQYPWSMHCLFRVYADRARQKIILYAADGPSSPIEQYVRIYIDSNFGIPLPGKVVVEIRRGAGTTTAANTSVTVDDNTIHRLAIVQASPTNLRIYVDNVDVTVPIFSLGSAIFPDDLNTGYAVGNTPAVTYGDFGFSSVPFLDVLDEVLILDGYGLSAADVSRLNSASVSNTIIAPTSGRRVDAVLNTIGWAAADRDTDDGLTAVQAGYVAGKASAYLNQLALTEGGRVFVNGAGQVVFHDRYRTLSGAYMTSQATFGEGAGEIGYVGPFNHGEDDQDIYNDVRVSNVDGAVHVARSKASKDRYGWKTLSLTDLLGTSDAEARDRANRDLALYSEPVTRVRQLIVKPQEDAAQGTTVWPNLLGLGQNSRVTVKATPPGAALFTQQSHVERMEETVTPEDWQIVLGLSAAQSEEFWVLGTSALDTGTRLAY
jgi:hypothetical protein